MKLSKGEALTLGSVAAPLAVLSGAWVYSRDETIAVISGGFYLLFCAITGPAIVVRAKIRGEYAAWTPRELFMWPFLMLFLAPMWSACAAVAYDWRTEDVTFRTIVIGFLFAATLPSLYLWARLAGMKFK